MSEFKLVMQTMKSELCLPAVVLTHEAAEIGSMALLKLFSV